MNKTRYSKSQRERKNPPVVTVRDMRAATGLTLDQVCERFEEATGEKLTKGALSAIETGLRGISPETAAGIALAYGLDPVSIITDYDLPMAATA